MVFFARKARKEKKSTQAPLTSTKGEKTLLASSLLRIPPRVHVLAMPQPVVVHEGGVRAAVLPAAAVRAWLALVPV